MKQDSRNAQPLSTAALYILLALASDDLHGYGIIQEIARQSEGGYRIGPGTLYDNLKKLMDQKLVIDAPRTGRAKEDDRRLYRITTAGKAALSAEITRMQNIVVEAKVRLGERGPRNA